MTDLRLVPLLDLSRTDEQLQDELVARFRSLLAGGKFILGPEVEAFEGQCAEYLGCRHAVGVSSGSDALVASMMALGIGPGDEVVCPAFTFFATAGAIARLGARPVFTDCGLQSFDVRARDLEAKISARTKAIVVVHLFGQSTAMDAILDLATARSLPVVEDVAQSFGARWAERTAGTLGACGCFSFFPSKVLGAYGDAGLVATEDEALADTLRRLRVHGAEPKYRHGLVGGNFRLDALQAALLRCKMSRVDANIEHRQRHAARYSELFVEAGVAEPNEGQDEGDRPILVPIPHGARHVWNQYTVRVSRGRRDALRAFLRKHGVGTEVYYPTPLHLQPCFEDLGGREGLLPNAERASREVLSLPLFPELTDEEVTYVVDSIARFFRAT